MSTTSPTLADLEAWRLAGATDAYLTVARVCATSAQVNPGHHADTLAAVQAWAQTAAREAQAARDALRTPKVAPGPTPPLPGAHSGHANPGVCGLCAGVLVPTLTTRDLAALVPATRKGASS